ncbi:glycosyltransferase (plasmid) [Azospirillum baldaniorum]|uniref:Glycosyltransferase n=1 Tax=Azospirillum baldaniorum TaxID=1064539 RepID=A0A9P1K1Q2_9PROT|nr:glycosyltransferase [Azospirillum baldaniorum]AWJ93504.1 glycosyltransferase [Azospirillum baldaniorum]NUB05087.1 glycosyltransferase [Azospirillum baldaniorum]TWA71736.1 glycosyltransferase involved in cell wall biosynthesis [Azospirillum brasilense]CCD03938.1 putative glycosyltransferase [Azospirillum baldaniorum]
MDCPDRFPAIDRLLRLASQDDPEDGLSPIQAEGFDEHGYLALNPDVRAAVETGQLPSGFHHYAAYGWREGRAAPGLTPYAGRRCAPAAFAAKPCAISLFGPLSAQTGLGTAARAYAAAARASGLPVWTQDVDISVYGRAAQDDYARMLRGNRRWSRSPYRLTLLAQNADMLPYFFRGHDRALLDDAYTVGLWVWELANFRSEWMGGFGAVDEVWAPSTFCRDAFAALSPVPVTVMPYAVAPDIRRAVHGRAHFGIPDEVFTFLYVFDVSSYMERKNPFALIRAFKQAFGEDPGVLLLLKHHSGAHDPERLRRLRDEARAPNIRLLPGLLDEAETLSLKRVTDCFVSPHRSEGFGLNIAEAMHLGKPVIATDYAASTDFLNETNGYPVACRLVPVGQDTGPYAAGALWADPDIDHMADLMARVRRDRREAEAKGRRAAADIRRTLSPKAIGRRMRERMAELGLDQPVPPVTARVAASRRVAWRHPLGTLPDAAARGRVVALDSHPTISLVVPVGPVSPEALRRCVQSVSGQSYPFWELCLCGDGTAAAEAWAVANGFRGTDARIRIRPQAQVPGLAGAANTAVEMSSGGWVALLGPADALEPEALMEVARAIGRHPDADAFYTDGTGPGGEPVAKPGWSPEHLESCPYVGRLMPVRKSLFVGLGGFRQGFSTATEHDLALRIARVTDRVHHIPVALHRQGGESPDGLPAPAGAEDGVRKALADHAAARYGADAELLSGGRPGLFRVRRGRLGQPPATLILRGRTAAVLNRTSHPDLHVLPIDGSGSDGNGAVAAWNAAIAQSRTDLLVLLDEAVEPAAPDWLSALVDLARSPDIGVAGAALRAPDGRIVRAGLGIAADGAMAPLGGETDCVRNCAAVPGAVLAVRRTVLKELGGFDPRFSPGRAVSDLCLSALIHGYRNVCTPFAVLRHAGPAALGVPANTPSGGLEEDTLFRRKWEGALGTGALSGLYARFPAPGGGGG